MVRAKFNVVEIRRIFTSVPKINAEGEQEWIPSEVQTIIMSPVYREGDPVHENTKFWQATPSGRLELGCANLDAAQYFALGKEYYLDFTEAG